MGKIRDSLLLSPNRDLLFAVNSQTNPFGLGCVLESSAIRFKEQSGIIGRSSSHTGFDGLFSCKLNLDVWQRCSLCHRQKATIPRNRLDGCLTSI